MPKSENKFNDLGPKEWLPFQKSFTEYKDLETLVDTNLKFFTKPSISPKQNVLSIGSDKFSSLFRSCSAKLGLSWNSAKKSYDFLAADLIKSELPISDAMTWVAKHSRKLNNKKFLWVLIPTNWLDSNGFPIPWKLSTELAEFLTRKDEKIICLPNGQTWTSLYFRKDEISKLYKPDFNYPDNGIVKLNQNSFPDWFILKPKPRTKNEVLHPAKYPEELVQMYVKKFTNQGEIVFDPMSGTGTTQVESLRLGRKAYGIELSKLFHDIATEKCAKFQKTKAWRIELGDARKIETMDFPKFDYVITSPPYWDMLNMKGAKNQALRKAKGLQTNYSDNRNDLGNLNNYTNFVKVLVDIYRKTANNLKSSGHITIVVKNIKKKGKLYPLAFDLTNKLMEYLEFIHVGFWCQDDIQISPYGYKHTWVSNTFHHYCVTFKKH